MRLNVPDSTIVVMGATGDLTKRKLIPALYKLLADGLLTNYVLIGTGREATTVERIFEAARVFVDPVDPALWKQLQQNFRYIQVNFYEPADFKALKALVEQEEKLRGLQGNRLFFLATMPEHFGVITQSLAEHDIVRRNMPGEVCGDKACSWQRVIYEKPFGQDLASAKEINRKIADVFSEQQAFRIDHYLGKELVANIAVIRFANTILEPLWNNLFIESVQVILKEAVGVEQRGAFYDQYGALKDVVQNHMLQLVALVAMELPPKLDGEFIRDAKVALLKKVSIIDALFGQYTGYQQEPYVAPDSRRETFAALKLAIDNDRWRGVPFFLKTGKALDEKSTSIHITFRKSPHLRGEYGFESNVLTITIEPDEGFSLQLNGKMPGKTNETTPVEMKFCHSCLFGPNTAQAYEVLLLDALHGDQSVFVRFDEIEESWRVVDTLGTWSDSAQGYAATSPYSSLKSLVGQKIIDAGGVLEGKLCGYARGSSGPEELKEWNEQHSLIWHR